MKEGEYAVIFPVLLFLIIYLVSLRLPKGSEYHSDYIGKDQTAAVNGLFTLLIVVSHFVTYTVLRENADIQYLELKRFLGQLVVTPFLFYSGYGIHRSIAAKGRRYINTFPWLRFSKVLLHFDVAILLYVIVGVTLLDKEFTLRKILYSLIGWESVGNSNWYIFAVLAAYAATFIAFMIFGEKGYGGVIAVTVLSFLYVGLMKEVKDTWWYDTFFCYAAGMWYSVLKDKIDSVVQSRTWVYLLSVCICACAFHITHTYRMIPACYQLHGIFFVLLFVLLSMKLICRSRILIWIGQNAFWIYILQRLPMQVLKKHTDIEKSKFPYFILCLGITLLLAWAFGVLFKYVDRFLFSVRKRKAA